MLTSVLKLVNNLVKSLSLFKGKQLKAVLKDDIYDINAQFGEIDIHKFNDRIIPTSMPRNSASPRILPNNEYPG